MGEVEERKSRRHESLLSRIQDQAGKSLEDIERDWTAQLQARHNALKDVQSERVTTAAGFFERTAEKNPDKVFLVYGGNIDDDDDSSENGCDQCIKRELTYEHVDSASNAVACWALKLQEEMEGKRPDTIACAEHDSGVTCSECAPHSRVAALIMRSSPECLIIFLGLVKAGMTVAMLHPRLRGVLLRRALEEAGARMLICDGVTVKSVRETWGKHIGDEVVEGVPAAIQQKRETGSYPVSTFVCGRAKILEEAGEFSLFANMYDRIKGLLSAVEDAHFNAHQGLKSAEGGRHTCKPYGFPLYLKTRFHSHLAEQTAGKTEENRERLAEERDLVDSTALHLHSGSLGFPCCYLYGADLQGNMRATLFSHWRFISAGLTWQFAVPLSSDDRLLTTMQLSHEVGLHAVASTIACGGALLLRSKSSLLELWPDISALECTVLWHTGTVWSRLLKASERFHEEKRGQRLGSGGKHSRLRVSIGTGLVGELWPVVQEVFGVPRLIEFHSTPNLLTGHLLMNSWGVRGACGFVPNSAYHARGIERLVAINEETGELVRDGQTNWGKQAVEDNVTHRQRGELVTRVQDAHHCFAVLTHADEENECLYRDLFEKGDIWCRSGDLLERDAAGFFHPYGRIGPNFRLDGEAAPRVELAAFLEQIGGVFGARVEALQVFSRRIDVQGAAGDAATRDSDLKEVSNKWPESIVELLREGAAQHQLKCLVACVHAKLGGGDTSQGGDEVGNLPACGAFDLDSSLLVIKEKSGWSAKAMLRGGGTQEAEISVQAFLRKLRHSLDCGVPIAMRPVVLMLCFGCGSAENNSDRRGSAGSTCGSCRSDIGEETASICCCGCCVGCHCCRSHRQSIEALCELVDGNGCGSKEGGSAVCGSAGSTCKMGACKRCCFLFYADVNGDAFVPLKKQTFNDFVQENYADFGL
ncbi:hypothetical protein Esti_000894 [Eimeria stiedai]